MEIATAAISNNIVYPALVFFCMILIWIGGSMWVTHVAFDAGQPKTMMRNGGIVLLVGLTIAGGVKFWRANRSGVYSAL